jgi:hypothetical protein
VTKILFALKAEAAIAAMLFVLGIFQQSAVAQEVIKPLERPDPARITVPDLSFTPTPHDIKNFDSHYYFYKTGVSYEAAFADLDECRMYSLASDFVAFKPPKFVPLGDDIAGNGSRKDVTPTSSWRRGLRRGILVAVLVEQAHENDVLATTNRCMAYKGYGRYGVSRAIADEIDTGSDAEKLARQALIASGPKPAMKAIDP